MLIVCLAAHNGNEDACGEQARRRIRRARSSWTRHTRSGGLKRQALSLRCVASRWDEEHPGAPHRGMHESHLTLGQCPRHSQLGRFRGVFPVRCAQKELQMVRVRVPFHAREPGSHSRELRRKINELRLPGAKSFLRLKRFRSLKEGPPKSG